MMVEDLFIELVVLFVAIAPFVAIWRYPASLLSKSLATVVALLFFMIILLGLLRSVARDYNQRPIIKSMQTIGRLLSEEKLPPENISVVIRQWQASGEGYHKLLDALKNMLPSKPTESAKPSEQTEPSEQQPTAAPAEPPAAE
ncbi:MAG: hypothetical protein J6X49_09305 [Victivallales bacterium]|nr:hypothetical protein [Victivallales bacterium]